jgi:hypothetical protein
MPLIHCDKLMCDDFYTTVDNKDQTKSIVTNKVMKKLKKTNGKTKVIIKLDKIKNNCYFICDNKFNVLYNVAINENVVNIYKPIKVVSDVTKNKLVFYKKYEDKNIKTIVSVGRDVRHCGNRILIKIENRYIFIGETISEFTIKDEIRLLVSIYNNEEKKFIDYAVGDKYTFLLTLKLKIKNIYCITENPYLQYNSGNRYKFVDYDGKRDNVTILDNVKYFSKYDENKGKELKPLVKQIKTTTIKKITSKNNYNIHDNGGRTFKAKINKAKNEVEVFKNVTEYNYDSRDDNVVIKWEFVKTIKYKNLFLGSDDFVSFYGNSILLQNTARKYTLIAFATWQFTIDDIIIKFISVVGNSGVTWPYAIGTKYVYDLTFFSRIAIENLLVFPPWNQLMGSLFDSNGFITERSIQKNGINMENIKNTLLINRNEN